VIRRHPDSPARATALVAALFAITLNFLQPLAHAALLRDGNPQTLWSMFCKPSMQQGDSQTPDGAAKHECCLGLAHTPALATPAATFILVEPVVVAAPASLPADPVTSAAIRDGPTQPRGPPLLA
jgi:hypothetical protein